MRFSEFSASASIFSSGFSTEELGLPGPAWEALCPLGPGVVIVSEGHLYRGFSEVWDTLD